MNIIIIVGIWDGPILGATVFVLANIHHIHSQNLCPHTAMRIRGNAEKIVV